MAINKYCYISVRPLPPFFEHRHRIVYSKVELVRDPSEIQHPAVRGVLTALPVTDGLEIHHDADLPARSGLGSSSAFTVGLLHALNAFRGRMMTKRELSQSAIHIEQDVLHEAVGCQDQIWATYGGLNHIEFRTDGEFEVSPLILPSERRAELQQSLMLFFTGFSRYATDFAQDQLNNIPRRTAQLSMMRQMVDQSLHILRDERTPIREIGKLLHEGWRLKRELADSVSTPQVDEIYEAALSAGAIGGKLLGAGGGGFMVFFVEPENRERLRERLRHLVHVTFDIDNQGSKIVLYQPDGL